MARIEASVPCLWIYSGQQWACAGMTVVEFLTCVAPQYF
jgi:hypothetical protein